MSIALLLFSQFSLADSLYAEGYYNLAQIEYKREFFFYPDLKTDYHKRLKLSIALMKNDESKGIQELNNIIDDFPDLEPEIKIKMAKCYLNLGAYYQASELLHKTDEKKLLGLTYILDDKFSSAQNLFFTIGDYEIAREINAFINRPKRSIKTAVVLSFICPGAGDVYAGNIKLGIKDFLLNVGSGYLLYNALKQKKYVDAVLVFNFLLHRFYLGSIYNAQKSVEEWNERYKQRWLDKIKSKYFKDIDLNY